MKLGLTLPNRGVLFGATTAGEMLDLAEIADASGQFQSVWVGDSLFGKPRMEAIVLLAGIAGRTKSVRLGPAFAPSEASINGRVSISWLKVDRSWWPALASSNRVDFKLRPRRTP